MGYFHFQLKKSTKNHTSAAAHYSYIMREGKHTGKDTVHEFVMAESINIPAWANEPQEFFKAADQYERKNGIVYRELEIGLPNQLSLEENIKLVHQVIENCIGQDKAVSYAIHKKYSKINQELGQDSLNIHVHIMFSERSITDLQSKTKPAELFFKRYNSNNPENGGYKKDRRFTGSQKENDSFLVKSRKIWAQIVNAKFKELGIDDSISPLSINEQKQNADGGEGLTRKKASWIPYQDYKKIEVILKTDCSTEEKISRIVNLDVQSMINGKQKKKVGEGRYSSRFRQKLISLSLMTNAAKEKKRAEEVAKEILANASRTRYIGEIVADIGLRLVDAARFKNKKVNRIENSPYYDMNRLKFVAINIVTNGLYNKHGKIIKEINELQTMGKDAPHLIKKADVIHKELALLINPENSKKAEEIYKRLKDHKLHFMEISKELKADIKVINNYLKVVTNLADSLKKESNFSNINNLMPQDDLKTIENAIVTNKNLGIKGFERKELLPLIENIIKFVKETETKLEERIEKRNRSMPKSMGEGTSQQRSDSKSRE